MYNGTSPTRKILGDECVTNFLTLNTLPEEDPRHFDSVELYYKNNRENMEVPDYLLPFASYTNGSPIFVNLLPPNLGYVYLYISHHDKLVLLNTNFVEFINDLRLFDDL